MGSGTQRVLEYICLNSLKRGFMQASKIFFGVGGLCPTCRLQDRPAQADDPWKASPNIGWGRAGWFFFTPPWHNTKKQCPEVT